MTPDDDAELAGLTEQLKVIDSTLGSNLLGREALHKAGVALILAFLSGRRQELEEWYRSIDAPLTEDQRAHLRRLGIEPGDH